VVLNGKASSWAKVLSGVPQGSVLGPILFLVYINDIDGAAMLIEAIKKFADDTKLGNGAESEESRRRLQETLDRLVEWARIWGMEYNVKKCKVMHFGRSNPKHVYSMGGQPLEETSEETDLGVVVNPTLKPAAQCRKAARTAQTVLAQITRAFHFRDRHIFMRLYTQYVRPHLEFATPAWSPWLAQDVELLEKVQRQAVGMVSGLQGRTYEDRLEELGMVTLEERRHQTDMAQVFKIVHGIDDVNKDTWFQALPSDRVTRAAADPLNFKRGACRLDCRRNFFSQRVLEHWNIIPVDLKNAKSVTAFRKGYQSLRSTVPPY
jgi:hypothetical protein